MDAASFLIQQEARKYESNCRSAAAHVARCTSIPDVVRAARVVAPPILRGVSRSLPATRALSAAVDLKLEALIDAKLLAIKAEPDLELRKKAIGRWRSQEWDFLRGTHAMQYRRADSGAAQLLQANP